MNIYFAAATVGIADHRKNYDIIVKTLRGLGHNVLNNSTVQRLAGEFSLSPRELVKLETQTLSECDLVILESSVTSFGIGYVFSECQRQRKPILALYLEGFEEKRNSGTIIAAESSLVTVETYNLKTIRKILNEYLANKRDGFLSKFNFIISPEVADYLDWGTYATGKSKSEFLRDKLVIEVIKRDNDYTDHLEKEHKKK